MAVSAVENEALSIPQYPIWRLSVDQYHQMIDAGILTVNDQVELLEGWLVAKMPKKPQHRLTTQLMYDALVSLLPVGWFVQMQDPITLATSEPEPDVAIIRGVKRDYAERHPQPAEVALVVEVSDATLQQDRTLKLRIYARAGIPVYWIINLPERRLEVYTQPEGAAYTRRVELTASDSVTVILDGAEVGRVAVGDLLA